MISIKFQTPLQWPAAYPATAKWDRSINPSFKAGLSAMEALEFLHEELNALKVQQATLYTDYEHIENPRLIRRVGQENGAFLHFKLQDKIYRIGCDRWVSLEQNLYALHLALRNLRLIPEWGVGNTSLLFAGFGEVFLGAKTTSGAEKPIIERRKTSASDLAEWQILLGLGPTATLDDAHAVYRRRAKIVATDTEALLKLNLAMEEAEKALGS